MREIIWRGAFGVWLIGLVVSLVSIPFGGAIAGVAFPISLAAALIVVTLCYGLRGVLTRLVPLIAGLALLGFGLRAVHVPEYIWLAVVPALVVFGLRRLDRSPGVGPRWS